MSKLTDQQKTFALEYVRSGFDRQQACQVAGYSLRCWPSIASKLLKKSQVSAEISRLINQVEEKCSVETTEIIQELRKIAFSPPNMRVSNSDKLRALELLGKSLAMFSAGLNDEGGGGVSINIMRLDSSNQQLKFVEVKQIDSKLVDNATAGQLDTLAKPIEGDTANK